MQKQILHILRVFIRACYLFSYYQLRIIINIIILSIKD